MGIYRGSVTFWGSSEIHSRDGLGPQSLTKYRRFSNQVDAVGERRARAGDCTHQSSPFAAWAWFLSLLTPSAPATLTSCRSLNMPTYTHRRAFESAVPSPGRSPQLSRVLPDTSSLPSFSCQSLHQKKLPCLPSPCTPFAVCVDCLGLCLLNLSLRSLRAGQLPVPPHRPYKPGPQWAPSLSG